MGTQDEANGVVKFWLRLGSVCAAAIAIITLAAMLQRYAIGNTLSSVNGRLDEIVDTVNLVAGALVETDSLEQRTIISELRKKRRAVR